MSDKTTKTTSKPKPVGLWVKDVFEYCPSGNLIWKTRVHSSVKKGDIAGYFRPDGRRMCQYKGVAWLINRLVYAWHNDGNCPPIIDHINQDPSDNRIENLRPLSHADNLKNSSKVWGKTPYRGVIERNGKYLARVNGKYRLRFDTPEEAYEVYMSNKK